MIKTQVCLTALFHNFLGSFGETVKKRSHKKAFINGDLLSSYMGFSSFVNLVKEN